MEPHDSGIRVLLVDDEAELLASVSQALTRRGLMLSTADSGAAALHQLRQASFDVMVLDVKMPRDSGLEVLRKVRREWPEMDVVMLTGRPDTEEAVMSFQLGAVDYLRKPMSIAALVEAIEKAWRRRREAGALPHASIAGTPIRDPSPTAPADRGARASGAE